MNTETTTNYENKYSIKNKVVKSAEYINSFPQKNVSINEEKLKSTFEKFQEMKYPSWSECHRLNIQEIDIDSLISFILCIDAVNFCFWPYNDLVDKSNIKEFEYDDLVTSFRNYLPNKFNLSDNLLKEDDVKTVNLFSPGTLKSLSADSLIKLGLFPESFPLLEERARSLNEVGQFIENTLCNKASRLLELTNNCCLNIAGILIQEISTFRDESLYKQKQVFLYKRAQIASADLYSALSEKGIFLYNSERLTMFPDYRIPQILHEMGILVYSDALNYKIINKECIIPHSAEEIEIRLMTVHCVEIMKRLFKEKNNEVVSSIFIDYMLWNEGEKLRKEIVPHHRALTIFY